MSSRIFQSVIVQMKESTDRVIGVVDSEGTVVASNDLHLIGTALSNTVFHDVQIPVIVEFGRTYKLMGNVSTQYEYAVFVDGEDDFARALCVMASVAFREAKLYYEEKHDKLNFIKNIISDNILPGDILSRAKELQFPAEVPRVIFLIRLLDKQNIAAAGIIQDLFPDKEHDFIISVTETDIVLVKTLETTNSSRKVLRIATEVETALKNELSIKTVIGVSSTSAHLRDLADRYKEAQVAIEVGRVFETEKTIINYENLGIGRLIYQLPITLCEMFLSEVFKKSPIDSLDHETLFTINKLFENNLNLSETSRRLFVHRNTLVYRLEKIRKLTGLDLREFDHAIVFKVALMVRKYLKTQELNFQR